MGVFVFCLVCGNRGVSHPHDHFWAWQKPPFPSLLLVCVFYICFVCSIFLVVSVRIQSPLHSETYYYYEILYFLAYETRRNNLIILTYLFKNV